MRRIAYVLPEEEMLAAGLANAGYSGLPTAADRTQILPLVEPERAQQHGVVPPHAIVLFGPLGTGKTTFAHGIASRLGWPVVELLPLDEFGHDISGMSGM